MGEQYAPEYDDGYNYPEYDNDDGYIYNNMGGGYRNYMGAKSFKKGPPTPRSSQPMAYGARSFKGSGRVMERRLLKKMGHTMRQVKT